MSMVRVCAVGIGSSGRGHISGGVIGAVADGWCWSRSAASVLRR